VSVEAAPRPAEQAVTAPPSAGPPSDLGAYLSIRSAEWLGMRLPRRTGLALANLYFRWHYRRAQDQRRVVAGNLAQVLGHDPHSALVQSATRECFRLYARYWYETFALRTMPVDEVDRRFTIDGLEHADRALAAGRGVVLALPHMGNWDAAGHWLCVNGYRMTAVAEELRPRSVFELFLRHRRALGMGIVPLSEGSRVAETLIRLLSENHIITLVADRDLTGRGVQVEMFGAKRLLPAGPAMLSLATGAPLCVCAVFTTAEGWHTVIGPPVQLERTGVMRQDVTALTSVMAAEFERYIASAPADWHMFQPAWDVPA
jgi:lauroyl/myristoyl acyltransferase